MGCGTPNHSWKYSEGKVSTVVPQLSKKFGGESWKCTIVEIGANETPGELPSHSRKYKEKKIFGRFVEDRKVVSILASRSSIFFSRLVRFDSRACAVRSPLNYLSTEGIETQHRNMIQQG